MIHMFLFLPQDLGGPVMIREMGIMKKDLSNHIPASTIISWNYSGTGWGISEWQGIDMWREYSEELFKENDIHYESLDTEALSEVGYEIKADKETMTLFLLGISIELYDVYDYDKRKPIGEWPT